MARRGTPWPQRKHFESGSLARRMPCRWRRTRNWLAVTSRGRCNITSGQPRFASRGVWPGATPPPFASRDAKATPVSCSNNIWPDIKARWNRRLIWPDHGHAPDDDDHADDRDPELLALRSAMALRLDQPEKAHWFAARAFAIQPTHPASVEAMAINSDGKLRDMLLAKLQKLGRTERLARR